MIASSKAWMSIAFPTVVRRAGVGFGLVVDPFGIGLLEPSAAFGDFGVSGPEGGFGVDVGFGFVVAEGFRGTDFGGIPIRVLGSGEGAVPVLSTGVIERVRSFGIPETPKSWFGVRDSGLGSGKGITRGSGVDRKSLLRSQCDVRFVRGWCQVAALTRADEMAKLLQWLFPAVCRGHGLGICHLWLGQVADVRWCAFRGLR